MFPPHVHPAIGSSLWTSLGYKRGTSICPLWRGGAVTCWVSFHRLLGPEDTLTENWVNSWTQAKVGRPRGT